MGGLVGHQDWDFSAAVWCLRELRLNVRGPAVQVTTAAASLFLCGLVLIQLPHFCWITFLSFTALTIADPEFLWFHASLSPLWWLTKYHMSGRARVWCNISWKADNEKLVMLICSGVTNKKFTEWYADEQLHLHEIHYLCWWKYADLHSGLSPWSDQLFQEFLHEEALLWRQQCHEEPLKLCFCAFDGKMNQTMQIH